MKIPFCLPLIDKDVNHEALSCLNEIGWLTTGVCRQIKVDFFRYKLSEC